MDDNRIDFIPKYYNDCPEYWKRFFDKDVLPGRISIYESLTGYNVDSVDKVYDPNYHDQYSIKVVFKTFEDLVYFKLRWS